LEQVHVRLQYWIFRVFAALRRGIPNWQNHHEAIARASGALELLKQTRNFPSLSAAIADCQWVVAVSADVRDFGPDLVDISSACVWAGERLRADNMSKVAFVFGSERFGLARDEAARGHLLACIPGKPDYHSLNLSQAVLITAWELRKQLLHSDSSYQQPARHLAARRLAAPPAGEAASVDAIEGLMEHLEEAATAVGFLDPRHPKMLMPRLRRLLMRSELRVEEVDLLRGLCSAMLKPRQRMQLDPVQGRARPAEDRASLKASDD